MMRSYGKSPSAGMRWIRAMLLGWGLLGGVHAQAATDATIQAYLAQRFPCRLDRVRVETEQILIEGWVDQPAGDYVLGELPIDLPTGARPLADTLVPLNIRADGSFAVEVPRRAVRSGRACDRFASRWQLYHREEEVDTPCSHARYPDEIACRSPSLPALIPMTKKGLGGWTAGRIPDEVSELGLAAVTVNVVIHRLVSLEPQPGHTPFEWQGRTYFANDQVAAELDRTFRQAAEEGLLVSVIVLVANPAKSEEARIDLLGHPEAAASAMFAMPNMNAEDGVGLYGAILDWMASRWSGGEEGRIHHWIMHNEVDAGWVWTNAGEQTELEYMDLYVRSMRLAYLTARRYDPHAGAFISLDHHWAKPGQPRWYASRSLLEILQKFCQIEGDFEWGLAYHPYPQSLGNPRTWEDQQATFAFDTQKITPRNLEVLDDYMRRPEMLYRGRVRCVHLSENGFHSRDYSTKSLEEQAAGMAWAWKKISRLPSVQVWHYHNWIDNRHEGGLRIGLRKFPDDLEEPLGKKPIWYLYQALGTTREEAACAPYLKTIGIDAWDEIFLKGR